MKTNIYKKVIIAFFAVTSLVACSDRELVTVDSVGTPMVMDLSSQDLFLDQNFPGNPALTVSWSAAEYSVPVSINYSVEISSTENFAAPYELSKVIESNRTVSLQSIN